MRLWNSNSIRDLNNDSKNIWVFFLEYWSITLSPKKISARYQKNSDLWNFLNEEGHEPNFDVFRHIFKVQTLWNATIGFERVSKLKNSHQVTFWISKCVYSIVWWCRLFLQIDMTPTNLTSTHITWWWPTKTFLRHSKSIAMFAKMQYF